MRTLFDKTNINNIELNNRIVRSATWERMANDDGHLNERLLKIYQDLAQGGVGMIITGYAFVVDHEQPNPKMMGIYDDSFINDYQQLTKTVHKYHSKIILQIAYGGSQTRHQTENRVIWGPSVVTHPRTGVTPIAMTQQHIAELIDAFASASVRAKQAGFDGVQLHGAHGYLLSQFLSPYYNRRNDKYGGSLHNRMRIICEIYEETRARVGNDFNIMIKINCSDFSEQGFTFEECQTVCKELAEIGFSAIEISGANPPNVKPNDECIFADYAAKIADMVNIPIIVVNKNRTPEKLTELLNKTKIEYFSMSRPLICEPNLVERWQKGDNKKAKCVSCSKCFQENGIKCVLK